MTAHAQFVLVCDHQVLRQGFTWACTEFVTVTASTPAQARTIAAQYPGWDYHDTQGDRCPKHVLDLPFRETTIIERAL